MSDEPQSTLQTYLISVIGVLGGVVAFLFRLHTNGLQARIKALEEKCAQQEKALDQMRIGYEETIAELWVEIRKLERVSCRDVACKSRVIVDPVTHPTRPAVA